MLIEDAMVAAVDALLAEQIPFMIVGSFSSNLYGIPRSTEDGDLVFESAQGSIQKIMTRLGSGFRLDPQIAFESVTGSLRHVVEVADTGFKIEFFHLSRDPHDVERFARRTLWDWRGRKVWLPTPEDVIVMKLRWLSHLNRSKDRGDVRDVMSVQNTLLDWDYIESWCDRHDTRQLLEEIRATIPPAIAGEPDLPPQ